MRLKKESKSPERKNFDDLLKPKPRLKHNTFEGWARLGFHVIKGEVAMKWNKKGKALFNEEQVEEEIFDLIDLFDHY